MTLDERFADAQARVKTLSASPPPVTLLELYSLFKQATVGDVEGKRPGMLDIKGRAKWDAWAAKKGVARDKAMEGYIALVDSLVAK